MKCWWIVPLFLLPSLVFAETNKTTGASEAKSQPFQIKGRIDRISCQNTSYSVSYSLQTSLKHAKRPAFRFFILQELNLTRYLQVRVGECRKGIESWMEKIFDHKRVGEDDVVMSKWSESLTEVDMAPFRSISTDETRQQPQPRGMYGAKYLCFRAELWQDGHILAASESILNNDLKRLDLPPDWWVWGKYPEKMKYGGY